MLLRGIRCACPNCRKHFDSRAALALHAPTGACMTTDEMRAAGMQRTRNGFWRTQAQNGAWAYRK